MAYQQTQLNQKFSYDEFKLPSPESYFRLLDLRPSEDHSASIIISLSCDSISSPRPYTALSYVWGQGGRTHKATVGGMEFEITESLDTAIRYLRHSTAKVTLWIDQICINQEDNTEKTEQVALMGKIYGLAEKVLVWLGPAADDSDQLMELWKDIGQKARDLGMERYWTREAIGQLRPISRDEVLGQNDAMSTFRELIIRSVPRFRALLKPMVEWNNRPWFRRVWVVQEFALPKKAPVYVCGRKMVDSDLVYLGVCVFRLSGSQLSKDEPLNSASRADVQNLMNKLYTSPISTFTVIRKQRQAFEAGRCGAGDSILDLLRKMYVENEMDATDERDRIFALIYLATDSENLGLKPDYKTNDHGLLLTQLARALITKSGRLELLSWAQFPKEYPKIGTVLPTWVPDWRSGLAPSYNPLVIPRAGQEALFSASAGASPSFEQTADERILALKGILVCTAEEVGAEWKDDDDGRHIHRVEHMATIENFCEKSAALNQDIYESPTRREEAIWRVPIGDLYLVPHSSEKVRADRSGQSMEELYSLCVENSRYMGQMGDSEDGRFRAGYEQARNGISYMLSMSHMENKKPFLTEKGYIGVGPKDMTPTDVVVIFAGAHIPHVLRRSNFQGPSVENYWEYVGEAYCDGVMDGEVWNERKLETFYVV